MKVVIYHADASIAEKFPSGLYKKLFEGFKENLKQFKLPLVHLTVKGHEGWGDENHFYDGDAKDIIYNREKFFIEYLKTCKDNEVIWCTEPDARLNQLFPPLTTDLALLRRGDGVAITPSWRLAKKSGVPWFEEALSYYDLSRKDWNGDSDAYIQMWKNMGQPDVGTFKYNGMTVDLRPYGNYSSRKSPYSRQWKSHHKLKLVQ